LRGYLAWAPLWCSFGLSLAAWLVPTPHGDTVVQHDEVTTSGTPEDIATNAGGRRARRFVHGSCFAVHDVWVHQSRSAGADDISESVTDKDGNETTYGYDFLDRLTSAVERNSGNTIVDNRAYAYDLASNRQTQTINGSTTSFAYNAANQLCWTYSGAACGSPPGGATTYSYDANGNTAANSAGLDFDYNVRDQTTAFTAPGGSAISFGYAGAGQAERTSNGGTAQHNTLLGLSREGTTSWTRDPGGPLISQRASGGSTITTSPTALGAPDEVS